MTTEARDMDNAITPLGPELNARHAPAPAGVSVAALGRWAQMPAKTWWMLGLGSLALLALLVLLLTWGRETPYRVLYSNLSDKDGGAILAQLTQMNVPYKHAEGGAAILVPADKVHDVRLKLASQGLPKGSVTGLELMDNARFGQTQFQERLTFQRGLEGELTRSIMALGAVQSARVHLALPQQNGFFREQQKPSASVLLTLHPGRTLDRSQVAGIVHLVSASVAELNPKAVSVVDQSGTLLSSSVEGDARAMDAQQLQYVQQLEGSYLRRVVDLLEPVVGKDNLRATVTAEVDFSQSESTSEQFRPNQGDQPAAVRSHQSTEASQGGSANAPAGVPGATSNQPPTPATAPTQTSGPSSSVSTASSASGANQHQRREQVTNYEVDKTVRVTRNATGTVRRLNAAVVVNHRQGVDAKGKPQSTPLTDEELNKLTALVQESIGFNKERGDSVKVVNAPFLVATPAPVEDVPLWRQPEVQDLVRSLALPLALALLGLGVVFGVLKPALKRPEGPDVATLEPLGPDGQPAVGGQLSARVDDPLAMPLPAPAGAGATPGAVAASLPDASNTDNAELTRQLEQARAMARDNPAAVANILRGWVNGDAA